MTPSASTSRAHNTSSSSVDASKQSQRANTGTAGAEERTQAEGRERDRERERKAARQLRRDPLSHLSPLQRQIMLEILNSEAADPEKGVHISTIAGSLSISGITPPDVA